jgi:hypothetical protein
MITAGWTLFVAWAVAQVVWYRRAHVEAPAVVLPQAPRRIPPPRPVASVEARPHEAAGPPLDTIDVPDLAPPSRNGIVLGLS